MDGASVGTLPPVPALIPISALRHPHARAAHAQTTVVRGVRAGTGSAAAARLAIDRSPAGRGTLQRHRKSDRRRRHKHQQHRQPQQQQHQTTTLVSATRRKHKHRHRSRDSPEPKSPQPRVNPIFVWVRQQDTRIVEVRCEDYDKRNRIRLTKTPHGWRAIPRTETLATSVTNTTQSEESVKPEEVVPPSDTSVRKTTKTKTNKKSSKSKRKSFERVSRIDDEVEEDSEIKSPPLTITREETSSPAWTSPVNIESHLPSHTIAIPRKKLIHTPEESSHSEGLCGDDNVLGELDDDIEEERGEGESSVNSTTTECSASDDSYPPPPPSQTDTSALDNLLAVAEFEFNHQVRTEAEANKEFTTSDLLDEEADISLEAEDEQDNKNVYNEKCYNDITEQHKEYFENIVQLNKLIESRSSERISDNLINRTNLPEQSNEPVNNERGTSEDCDYNEDDENNLAMDDIITRLEQSLQSPDACAALDDTTEVYDAFPVHMEKDNAVQDEVNCEQGEAETAEPKPDMECSQEVDLSIDEMPSSQEEEEEVEEEMPTDLSKNSDKIIDEKEDEEEIIDNYDEPTDLSKKADTDNIDDYEEAEEEECVDNVEEDLMPTDLSVPKSSLQSPLPRTETPRPASHGSETIQSPQPSGIPAVPPSPDIFSSGSQKNKSIFLESLLSTTSPKLCLTPEVTITRQQKEPLDLGKSRKSASPTVTCSEEAKTDSKFSNSDGEPTAKRIKIEDITLKNLLHPDNKLKPEVTISKTSRSNEKDNSSEQKVESSRLLELLTTEMDNDPLTQLKQILADPELNIPDPLLVPKDRLSQVISEPAREIPRLLALRPELRLPEALAFPQLLQDPDILVISLSQLQTILYKQSETIKLAPKTAEKLSPKPSQPAKKIEDKRSPVNIDSFKYPNLTGAALPLEAYAKQYQQLPSPQVKDVRGSATSGLANDIDAATTAAFNQMLWLPYLNQLEAAAMVCGNNNDFMKALNSVFPPSVPVPDPQMFNRFGMPNGFPMHPPTEYNNQLEMALWQEALLKVNMGQFGMHQMQQQQRTKNPADNYNNMLKSAQREISNIDSRNSQSAKKHQSSQRIQSSARTSPISHNFQQQRSSGLPNPYLNSIPSAYQLPSTTLRPPSLQIPQYNPNIAQWNKQSPSSRINSSSNTNNNSMSSRSSSGPVPNYHNQYNSKSDYMKYSQNMNNNNSSPYSQRYNNHIISSHQKSQQSSQKSAAESSSQKPRVTCKSLQNLLSPTRLSQENALKKLHQQQEIGHQVMVSSSPSGTQPIDLTATTVSRLKVKQHLVDSTRSPKLLKHDDVPEVGSTTTEETQLQDAHAQQQLWHPLFGNQKNYTSPWRWTTVTVNGE